jgi:hypothetical protein
MKKVLFFICLLSLSCVFSCSKDDQDSVEFALVYFKKSINVNFIEGDASLFPPSIPICFSSYSFNPNTQTLFLERSSHSHWDMTNLKAIVYFDVSNISYHGMFHDHIDGGLKEYYSIPTQHKNLAIKKIYPNGSLDLLYQDSQLVNIESNQTWAETTTRIDTFQYYSLHLDSTYQIIAEVTTTDYLTNYGLRDKSSIEWFSY